MPRVEEIDPQFFGERVGPVGPFASDEGVDPRRCGLCDFRAGATGDNPDGSCEDGSAWSEMHISANGPF